MSGDLEALTQDFCEDSGCGPDTQPGHGGQDLGERVRIDHREDFSLDVRALLTQVGQLLG